MEKYLNTGMAGLFEVCFEQSWKAMKEVLESNGYSEGKTGSPKLILKTAYQAGLISDEEMWLSALASRNNIVHAYNKVIAMDIVKDTKEKYYEMFEYLQKRIEFGGYNGRENSHIGINGRVLFLLFCKDA